MMTEFEVPHNLYVYELERGLCTPKTRITETSRTVLAYNHDGIYIWALESDIFWLKANKLFCKHEFSICFENVNDNWLAWRLYKIWNGRSKVYFSDTKMFVTL